LEKEWEERAREDWREQRRKEGREQKEGEVGRVGDSRKAERRRTEGSGRFKEGRA
jgi:hypothetical protein